MDESTERLRTIALRLGLERPLCVLDLETTGTDVERDRIVEIAALVVSPAGEVGRVRSLVRPEGPVPEAARAIHGLGETELLGAPTFREIAPRLAAHLSPCDYAGYNVGRFDLRMLAAEFRRAGVAYDPTQARVIDAMTIFHRRERRDLKGAVKLYCGRDHRGHRAEEDVKAVIDVLHAQLERYPDLPRDVARLDALVPRASRGAMVKPLRVVLYDRTCGPLTASWVAGVGMARALGRIDAWYGARSWAEGLEWLASVGELGQIQYWGHGLQGQVLLAGEPMTAALPHRERLERIRARLSPEGGWWFRTCLTFGGEEGHRFARTWADFFERPVAGHTWVIGPVQAGLHVLRPGETPSWPVEEGDPKRVKGRNPLPLWLRPDAPRRITCLHGRLPDWA